METGESAGFIASSEKISGDWRFDHFTDPYLHCCACRTNHMVFLQHGKIQMERSMGRLFPWFCRIDDRHRSGWIDQGGDTATGAAAERLCRAVVVYARTVIVCLCYFWLDDVPVHHPVLYGWNRRAGFTGD